MNDNINYNNTPICTEVYTYRVCRLKFNIKKLFGTKISMKTCDDFNN